MNPTQQQYGGTPVSGGFDQSMQQAQQQPSVVQQATQPEHSGNWFTHLLPTIGGTVLPWVAGALLAPETGGLSLAASAALSGVGTAAGKATENGLEGKQILQGNDLTAGLEGAVGGAVGGAFSKAFGSLATAEKAGSGIAGGLEKRAANITNTAQQAADQSAAQNAEIASAQATRNNFGGAGVSRVRAANDLQGNQDLLQSWGLDHTSPQVMGNSSKAGLFIDDIDKAALGKGAPIKTTDLLSSKDITTASPEEQQALIDSGIIGEDGKLPAKITPGQVTDYASALNDRMRTLQGLSDNAYGQGNVDSYNQAQLQLKDLTNKYTNAQKLATSPEADAEIAATTVTPEKKAAWVEQFGQKQADYMEQAVNSAQTHQDLVKAKLPFAQMNTLSKLALQDAKDTASPLALKRAKTDINGDGVADANAPILPTAGDALQAATSGPGLMGKAVNFALHAKDSPTVLNTLSRISALGGKLAPTAGIVAATSPNLAADPVPVAGGTNDTMGNTMNGQVNGNDLANYIHAMEAQSALGTSFSAPATSLMSSIAPMLQHNQLLHAQMASMPGLYANAGGAQGLGGILSHISGFIPGTAAHTYEAQQADIAHQLGIDPRILPSLMQNQNTAGLSGGILGNLQGQLVY